MSDAIDTCYDLDMVGVLQGTDKCSSLSSAWDYLRHYERIFAPWRRKPINLLEIGVAGGASLAVWRSYFQSATIVGIDINPACTQFTSDRVAVEIGSQTDPGFLHYVCAKYPPTIIIDDGSHKTDHIIYSFERLFPALNPGGVYVVEDVAFHFERGTLEANSVGGFSVPGYFLDLARACLARAMPESAKSATPNYLFENIDSVSFIHSAIVIQKKGPRDISSALRFAERTLGGESATAHQYGRVAQYILRHNGPLDRAESMARRSVEMTDYEPEFADTLAGVLVRLHRTPEAAAILKQSLQIHQDNGILWARLGQLESAMGSHADAATALQKAAGLRPTDPDIFDSLSRILELMGDLGEALSAAQRAAELDHGQPSIEIRARRVEQLRGKLP